ncbi:hypothetical protein GCM10023100_33550 [Actinocorallia cavernae]|uniref:Uncharacterized protein n=2 Tax=Actinomycetes TaxID=1760 RepID=A0ABP8SPM9_9ACTN
MLASGYTARPIHRIRLLTRRSSILGTGCGEGAGTSGMGGAAAGGAGGVVGVVGGADGAGGRSWAGRSGPVPYCICRPPEVGQN